MDKIMLEFPLCCLSYTSANDTEKIQKIISYCLIDYSKKNKIKLDNQPIYYKGITPDDFNEDLQYHRRILLASHDLKITLRDRNISQLKEDHKLLSKHISTFTIKHGKDAYCRIGKKLCMEVLKGQFPYRQFAVLCAVQSILGKRQKFKRLTRNRIRYAMLGYKSKAIALMELDKDQELLTDKKIRTTIEVLNSKRLFTKFTYAKRQTFYTTRLNKFELDEAVKMLGYWVKDAKLYWAQRKANLIDNQVTGEIKSELKQLKIIKLPYNPASVSNA